MINPSNNNGQFDDNLGRYRCWCFGCCHVTTCVKIIAALETVAFLANVIWSIVNHVQALNDGISMSRFYLGVSIFGVLVFALILILLIVGLYKERPGYLVPHMVYQCFLFLFLMAGIVIVGILAHAADVNRKNNATAESVFPWLIVAIILLILAFFLEVLFFVNIWKCYRYFKEKMVANRLAEAAGMGQPAMYGNAFA